MLTTVRGRFLWCQKVYICGQNICYVQVSLKYWKWLIPWPPYSILCTRIHSNRFMGSKNLCIFYKFCFDHIHGCRMSNHRASAIPKKHSETIGLWRRPYRTRHWLWSDHRTSRFPSVFWILYKEFYMLLQESPLFVFRRSWPFSAWPGKYLV